QARVLHPIDRARAYDWRATRTTAQTLPAGATIPVLREAAEVQRREFKKKKGEGQPWRFFTFIHKNGLAFRAGITILGRVIPVPAVTLEVAPPLEYYKRCGR